MKEGSGKSWNVCLAVTGVVVAIVLLVMVLALMFKPQDPISTMDSIKLQDTDLSFNMFTMRVLLNVTLHVDVSVKNPNKFGYKYFDGIGQLNYRGQQIGDVPVPNGEISPGETKGVNLTLTIMADRLVTNPQVVSDVSSGTLPLNAFLRISGEVKIIGFIKFHVDSSSSCDFTLNISNRTVDSNECQYNTKL